METNNQNINKKFRVTLNIAKKLYQLGFGTYNCEYTINTQGISHLNDPDIPCVSELRYPHPTLFEAQYFLWEKFGVFVEVNYCDSKFKFNIINKDNMVYKIQTNDSFYDPINALLVGINEATSLILNKEI